MATKKNGNGDGDWGSKSPTSKLQDKLLKVAGEAVVEAMQAMTEAELRDRLVSLAQHEKETEEKLEEDEKIQELKNDLRDAQGPYKDALKSIKVQRQFAALRLEEMGKA